MEIEIAPNVYQQCCDMCNQPKPIQEVEQVWCCNECKCLNNESKANVDGE